MRNTSAEIKVASVNEALADRFPAVECGMKPLGHRVIVQLRLPPKKIGSLILVDYSKDTEKDVNQVARIVALGPCAFKNRDTLKPWPEGEWVKPGDFVRVPLYGGDKWEVENPGDKERPVRFATFNDHELITIFSGADPATMKGYL